MNSKENLSRHKLTPVLSGVAGEYYVAAELSARGYIASITLRNTRGVDIICTNSEASKSVAIQVKTNQGKNRNWILTKKSEDEFSDNLFYVFVNLNDGDASPDYFVVPGKAVAKQIKESHIKWLDTSGRGGKAHKDNTMRKFTDEGMEYHNRWDILGLDKNI